MSQTLFLKYRPQVFGDLVGQDSIVRTLRNALKSERPSHAYLFFGSRGTGKTSTARIFAKGLNCQNLQDGSPCGKCQICTDTANGSLVDVIEIDAASNTGVDNIRDLREKVNFSPNHAKRKVYIIDEVHMLSKGAFNALLKTLEEPPAHAFFLLATTELHKIPETIISRCQTFTFSRFSLPQLTGRLEEICKTENIQAETPALELIARKAEGGLRDAISLLEQISAETEGHVTEQSVRDSLGISPTETLEAMWDAIKTGRADLGIEILKDISRRGGDFRTFGHDFLTFLRGKMHEHLGTNEVEKVLSAIEEIEIALSRLKTTPIVELPLEIAVIKLCYLNGGGKNIPFAAMPKPAPVVPKPTPVVPKPIEKPVVETVVKVEIKTPEPAPQPVTKPAPRPKAKAKEKAPEPVKESTPPPRASNNEMDGFVFEEKQEILKNPEAEEPEKKSVLETPPPNKDTSLEEKLSEDFIRGKMEAIAVKAGIPVFAKKSFLTTVPNCEGNKIIFCAASAFHAEQLNSESVRAQLRQATNEVLEGKFTVEFSVKTKPVTASEPEKKEEKASINDFLNF